MEKKIFVTTSWDDGHILDKRMAELLDKYALKGTFYVPKCEAFETLNADHRRQLEEKGISPKSLTAEDILEISRIHELGAHTLSHPQLSKLPKKAAEEEIAGSKKYLEDIIGHEVKMFCYPRGDYSSETKKAVRKAGFIGARTVEMGVTGFPKDAFEFATTIQAYPWPVKIRLHKTYALPQKGIFSWENQAKRHFSKVLKHGGIFHIWGHSWEVEALGLWDRLEKVFENISNQTGVQYQTNGGCLQALGSEQHSP